MIEILLITYGVGFILTLPLFREIRCLPFYVDRNKKIRDYGMALLYAILWPIFLTILICGIIGWKK